MPHSSLRDFVEVVAIHKPQNHHKKTENKKKSLPFTPSSLRDFAEVVAIHKPLIFIYSQKNKKIHYHSPPSSLRAKRSNPQTINSKYKNRKEKEFTIIYQIKELIFNFQFSISYASFVSHFVGRQAKMIMQAYHFSTLCFKFQFLSQPPCCFATSPLTKGGKPTQATKSKYKNRK